MTTLKELEKRVNAIEKRLAKLEKQYLRFKKQKAGKGAKLTQTRTTRSKRPVLTKQPKPLAQGDTEAATQDHRI